MNSTIYYHTREGVRVDKQNVENAWAHRQRVKDFKTTHGHVYCGSIFIRRGM